jgi:hypothetical protein
MIKLAHLLPKLFFLTEGSSIPGALEGWLDPHGVCFYVKNTHIDWVSKKFGIKLITTNDWAAIENQNIRLKKMLYDKGWVRIIIQHDNNIIYFESDDLPWQQFTNAQKRWLKDAALQGVKIHGNKIVIDDKTELRVKPYRLQFGGGRGGNVDIDLQERTP